MEDKEIRRPRDDKMDEPAAARSLTTDAAILAAPTLAVVANHYLNKPKDPPPQKPWVPGDKE